MTKIKGFVLIGFTSLILLVTVGKAAVEALPASVGPTVPSSISYQGKLTDAQGSPLSGGHSMVFKLYNVASGGAALWTETQFVTVTTGLFNVYLGDVVPLPLGPFNGQTLYLGVSVDTDSEMTPRLRMATVPYAFAAQLAPPCAQTICGASCVNISTDVSNCGACGNACSTVNCTPTCTGGVCFIACNAGFGNCDNNAANGCEVNLNTNVSNCGSCGNACSTVNGNPSCTGGACFISCNAGFGNCDSNVANGCETNLNTSVLNCGACANACSTVNGTPSCTGGACFITCNVGFANCDNNVANGCEVNLLTDVNNCGTCNNHCATGHACVGGTCQ